MAYVAFDLDNTLGFFGLTNKLGNLWSKEAISNPEQSTGPVRISRKLEIKLARARECFAKALLKDNILFTVLRPNLDAMILPLLEAKRKRKLKSVIIYSNTGSDYSMELAKYLIEEHYKCRGFFNLMANHWHPLRADDHRDAVPGKYVEPHKTIQTLQKLFKRATYEKGPVPPSNILFVDDRYPKHDLKAQEPEGLTYLVPSRFVPPLEGRQSNYLLFLAINALNEQGLLSSDEYLSSPFCNRNLIYDFTRHIKIRGIGDLIDYIGVEMNNEEAPERSWRSDTAHIKDVMETFLQEI